MQRIKKLISILILMTGDLSALFASFLLASFMRTTLLIPFVSRFKTQEPLPLKTQLNLGFIYGAVIIVLVLAFLKLYTKRFSFWDEARILLGGVTISFVLFMVLVFVSRQYIYFSRAVIVLAWLAGLFVFPFFRLVFKKIIVKTGLITKRVLILGTNNTARLVAQGILEDKTMGYEVVGFLAEEESAAADKETGIKIAGTLSMLKKVSQEMDVKDFILVLPSLSQNELVKIIEECDEFAESIRIVPNIGSLFTLGVAVENFGDVMSLSLNRNLVRPWNILLKTIFEYILIVLLSILFLPVFLLLALLIRIDSRGPVLFIQERLGKNGRTFRFIKFRSMYINCDQRLAMYLRKNPDKKEEWEKYQKIKERDPRVTRIGRFIRKFSLDEIPQLINVLKRDMNLVGPRPYLPREKERIGKSYAFISKIKPGITGLWQVRGRNLLPFKERILLDEFYIRNWSLWWDIVILFKTIRVLAKREGAF